MAALISGSCASSSRALLSSPAELGFSRRTALIHSLAASITGTRASSSARVSVSRK